MIEQDVTPATNLSLVLETLGCIKNSQVGRENQQACLYTAFKQNSYSLQIWSFGVPMKTCTAGDIRDWPNIVQTCLWPITENETFQWIYAMFEQMEFCGGL